MKVKIIIAFIFFVLVLSIFSLKTYAADITQTSSIKLNSELIDKSITDKDESSFIEIEKDSIITIDSKKTIAGLYIVYDFSSKEGILTANDQTIDIGKNAFLHEYININEKIKDVKTLTLSYNDTVKIADIYVLSEGNLPEYVEVWEPPCEKADLMLVTTHSDDEHLFFAGLLPTYVSRGASVQVVYFTIHLNNTQRFHEQLHGLYAVGIRNYPVIGIVPDKYSVFIQEAINKLKKDGLSEEEVLRNQVEIIRRFKPQVIVGHDLNGEYGHGQHKLSSYILKKAITLSNDRKYDNASKDKYGLWKVSKLYFHLYENNSITMDYDTPLEYFDGKTAFKMSQIAYSKHISQQKTEYTSWLNGPFNNYTKATDIQTYSPLKFGLYYTSVGPDVNKNDLLEHITYYKFQSNYSIYQRIAIFIFTNILLLILVIIIRKKVQV